MVILSASNLSLSFGENKILDGVSFSVNEGDKLGIIGSNGAGKTTLFRLLLSELAPDGGQVYLAKGKSVGYLSQNTALFAKSSDKTPLSVMYEAFTDILGLEDEIATLSEELQSTSPTDEKRIASLSSALEAAHRRYAEGGGAEVRGRCRAMLLRMGFRESELSLPISDLSGGQATRLSLCRLLISEPDILFLDEPTNHLDADALSWLEEFLAGYKKTVLLISHDRYFLDRVTNKTLKLERNHARLFPGNYSKARLLEAEEIASQTKRYKEQQKEIEKIEKNIAFQRKCGMEHNFVTIRSKQKQLDRMEKVEKVKGPERTIRLSFSGEESGNDVLTVKNLSFSYGEKPLLHNLSFFVRKGEKILFVGDNGCGKSTLMKLLIGTLPKKEGKIEFGYNVEIGYFDQENRLFSEGKTVFEEIADTYPAMKNEEIRSSLARFLFFAEDIEKKIAELSGGERARLTLCKLILKKTNLLILAEPTNHLVIGSREALEEALLAFPGTILAVSHDRYFIDTLSTRIIELSPEGAKDYPLFGNENPYAAYLALRQESRAECPPPEKKEDEEKQKRRESYEEKRKRDAERRAAERKVEAAKKKAPLLEARLSEIDEELFGEAASDYIRAAALSEEKQQIEEELLSLYELIL